MGGQLQSWLEFVHETMILQANVVIVAMASGQFSIKFVYAKVKVLIVVYKTEVRKGLM